MAVTAKWYGLGLKDLASHSVDWLGGTVHVALVTNVYVPNQDTDHFWSTPQANEVAGTGYTAAGVTLGTKTITYDATTNEVRLSAANVSWTTASFTARYAVVFLQVGADMTTPGDDILLGYVDFGADETVSAGTFSITWDATGVLKITAA